MSAAIQRNAPAITGMLLFLAAEAMFFGALLSSLVFMRVAAGADWPVGRHDLPIASAALSLAVLLAMAFAVAEAWQRARRGADPKGWLRALAALGCAAAACAAQQIVLLYVSGHSPAAHNLYGLYALVQGLIGLHAFAGGVCAMITSKDNAVAIEALGWFTHSIVFAGMIFFVAFCML